MVHRSEVQNKEIEMKLLSKSTLPSWFEYPNNFKRICDLKLIDLEPWLIMEGDYLERIFHGLSQRYSKRSLVPFAKREDCDDIACWEADYPGVVVIHDYASSGFEDVKRYDTFWTWFKFAVDCMIEHDE